MSSRASPSCGCSGSSTPSPFFILIQQQDALIGHDGILPADRFLERVQARAGSTVDAVSALPTLFWLDVSDGARHVGAWTGLVLSIAVLLGATMRSCSSPYGRSTSRSSRSGL